MDTIDSKILFKDLKLKPFSLNFTENERLRLIEAVRHWNKNFRDDDKRRLAFVLAAIQQVPEDKKSSVPTAEELRVYFDVRKSEWAAVRHTNGDVDGPVPSSHLANIFYTVLTKAQPITLSQVLSEELRLSNKGDIAQDDLEQVFKAFHAANLKAICFSGGGIRSATFGLGIVQALAKYELLEKFDYLSTVSGGGYLGSWMSAWIRRERLKKAAKFKAVSSDDSVSEIERAGDARIRGLSKLQIDALRVLLNDEMSPAQQETELKKLQDAGLTEKRIKVLRELPREQKLELIDDPAFRNAGIRSLREQINCIEIESDALPTPEPVQLRHLREYSNYMSPKPGLFSADTWTLAAIYSRNFLLNLTIFVPLIAAVLMLPRFLYLVIVQDVRNDTATLGMVAAAVLLGCIAFAFVISRLPSKRHEKPDDDDAYRKSFRRRVRAFIGSEPGVLLCGVLPLLASAFLASTAWAWNYRAVGNLYGSDYVPSLSFFKDQAGLGFFILAAVVAFVVGLLLFLIMNKFRDFALSEAAAALVSSIIGGTLLWLAVQKVFEHPGAWSRALGARFAAYEWQTYLCLSVPAFLLIVLIAATVYVGLSSRQVTDEDREWLARYGGWVLIFSFAWIVLNAVVLIGPSVLHWLFSPLYKESVNWRTVFAPSEGLAATISAIVALISGLISLGGGFSGRSLVREEPVKSRTSKFLAIAPQIAAVIFLGFILVGLAFLTTLLIYNLGSVTHQSLYHAAVLSESPGLRLLGVFAALALVGIVMGFFVNVNKFSLHGAYRDRLTRAYLGASNPKRNQNTFTGFDDSDNLELKDLEGQRPFHVINATVNLVSGKNLAWQNRKAASFTMTPLHCGSWAVRGYRRSVDYCVNATTGRALRLGTAMAISGAAANPNMGYISSPVVTFLMSLFNIRLGWWLGNTGPAGSDFDWFGLGNYRFFEKVGPSIAVFPLINETLGRTDEDKHFLNVSDGGHFENLALYEMILRRCRLIIVSDGAADFDFKFGEISNAIQKCKVDLGVDIKFTKGINIIGRGKEPEEGVERVRFAVAEITYPEKVNGTNLTGTLLYTRPAYYKDEYTDIRHYAEANGGFPHQSTADQMYDEKQFEAYRGLGYFTMDEVINWQKDPELAAFLKALTLESST